jgi:cation-transporting P-type ATPase C
MPAGIPAPGSSLLGGGLRALISAPGFLIAFLSPGGLWHLAALSGFMALRLVQSRMAIPAVSRCLQSMTTAIAALGTLSLAVRSIVDFREHRKLGLYPFLTAACALAVIAGEALTAVEILWVLSIGTFVEQLIVEKSRKAVSDLLPVAPEKTFALVDGVEVETPVEAVKPGDTVVIHEGERISVDGVVLEGKALVDEAHITGRPDAELRGERDQVFAGTRVVQGTLFVRAEKVGEDTYLSHILKLVQDSLAKPARVESKADELASRLVSLGGLATAATLVVTQSLSRSLSVLLIMSCPCATVLATSTALAAAIANGARRGVLIKGGRILERTQEVDSLVLDKTGTVTMKTPEVLEIIPRAPWQEPAQILRMAAGAEVGSRHPLAGALLAAAESAGLEPERPVEAEVLLGRGVRSALESDIVLVGSSRFMAENGIDPTYFRAKAWKYESSGCSVVYVARNAKLQGMIVVGNPLRPETGRVIAQLREGGIESCALVSGDSLPVVRSLAESLGIEDHRGQLLPGEKAEYVAGLQAAGKSVMMVGDGLNDALALAEARVGVAMGAGGSEVAIEAGDVALLDDNLEGLVHLRYLSQRTFRVIEQNFWMATLTNSVGAGLAVLGLVTPVAAGLLHTLHSLGIMLNSSRILSVERH